MNSLPQSNLLVKRLALPEPEVSILPKTGSFYFAPTSPLEEACERCPASREVENFFAFLKSSLRRSRKAQTWDTYLFLLRVYAMSLSHCIRFQGKPGVPSNLIEDFELELSLVSRQKSLSMMPTVKITRFNHTLEAMIAYLTETPELLPLARCMQTIRLSLNVTAPDNESARDAHLQEDALAGCYLVESSPRLQGLVGFGLNRLLPNEITDDPLYVKYFKHHNFNAEEMGAGTRAYQFRDEQGMLVQIIPNSKAGATGKFRIRSQQMDRQGQNRWYELQEASIFTGDGYQGPLAASGLFNAGTLTWVTADEPREARVISQVTKGLLCVVASDRICHPTRPNCVLVKDYDHPVLNHLARAFSKGSLLAWKDVPSGNLLKVEIADFGMAFEPHIDERGESGWISNDYHGFKLDIHTKSAAFEPFSHYIVLVNDQGVRMVLITSKQFKNEKIAFPDQPKLTQATDPLRLLFEYRLDHAGRVVMGDDLQALQYLIYLAYKQQNFPLCFQTLKVMQRDRSAWSEPLIQGMGYFNNSENENTHPEAVALRLHLQAIWIDQNQNALFALSRAGASSYGQIKADYIRYLNQFNNIPSYRRLSAEDEALLNAVLSETELYPHERLMFNDRMQEIRNGAGLSQRMLRFLAKISPGISITDQPKELKFPQEWGWLTQELRTKMIDAVENPNTILPHDFTVRPGIDFVVNFLYYYKILQTREQGPMAALVRQLLADCRHTNDVKVRVVRAALVHVAQSPNSFPPVEKLIESATLIHPLMNADRNVHRPAVI